MFNERLKSLRTELGMTQQDLADLSELSKPTISRFESGKKTPSRESVTKLAKIFNVTTDYLLGISDYRQLDSNKSNSVKEELFQLMNKIEKMDQAEQEILLKMLKGAVKSEGD